MLTRDLLSYNTFKVVPTSPFAHLQLRTKMQLLAVLNVGNAVNVKGAMTPNFQV